MAGTLNPQSAGQGDDLGKAIYKIAGTGTPNDAHEVPGFALVDPGTGLPLGQRWNGASFDLEYNNTQGVIVPSGARTATPAIATQTNPNHRGIMLYLNITASPMSATSTLTLSLNALEPITGTALYGLAKPAAITATAVQIATAGLYVLQLYPALPAVANMTMNGAAASVNGVLPRIFAPSLVHNDANSWTYSLSYSLLV